VVTVVVCDVSGSTALGERLDPESLGRVMARYFERTRTVLERHHGLVQQFIGDAVLLATRLQAAAGPGEILLDRRTRHLSRDALVAAGVGKSRLVAAAVDAIDAATVLSGQCASGAEGSSCSPLAEMVRRVAEIKPADSPDQAEDKLEALLEGPGGPEGGAPVNREAEQATDRLGRLIGLRPAPVTPEDAVWAVRRFLEVLAGRNPLVVVVDDLHWAQPALLDLIEQVVALAREAPILVVAVARPELLEQRPGWSGGRLNASTMLLEPLAAEAVALGADSDVLAMQAGALLDLAGVPRLAGRDAEAAPPARQALALAERKGHVVAAADARELLDATTARPGGATTAQPGGATAP
jgi:AAA ATPase domain